MKILYITPHLSTGGMPQYLLRKIQTVMQSCEVWCVEYSQISYAHVVQRNAIKVLLGDRFTSLQDRPKTELLTLIEDIRPDVIHFEEFPDTFLSPEIARVIYRTDRPYKIFETCHTLLFDPKMKWLYPDKFIFVSPHQVEVYRSFGVPADVMEYPIEIKTPDKGCKAQLGFEEGYKHIINVGLFTPGKNQGEVMDYARMMLADKVKFHFIGNQADNFKHYWLPLLADLPSNCTVWGERGDVDLFYQAADLMVFTSRLETSPLVVREAIGWQLPVLLRPLDAYRGLYSRFAGVGYLTDSLETNVAIIRKELCK